MKQHHINVAGHILPEDCALAHRASLKRAMLMLGWALPGLALLAAAIYLLSSGTLAQLPVDPAAAMSVEQTLGTNYVMQDDFVFGRFLLPLLISLAGAGAILFFVLRVKVKGQA